MRMQGGCTLSPAVPGGLWIKGLPFHPVPGLQAWQFPSKWDRTQLKRGGSMDSSSNRAIIPPIMQTGKLRHREEERHTPEHQARKRQGWDLSPGLPDPELCCFLLGCARDSGERGP